MLLLCVKMPAGGSPPCAKFASPELRTVAFALGRLWRQKRRGLPLDVRESFLDLLLLVQPYVVPSPGSCPVSIAEAREEVSGLISLCKGIATRGSINDDMLMTDLFLPPPPPPPLPYWCTADSNRESVPTILKLEELIEVCRSDDVSFASILNYIDLDTETTNAIASETNCVDEILLDFLLRILN